MSVDSLVICGHVIDHVNSEGHNLHVIDHVNSERHNLHVIDHINSEGHNLHEQREDSQTHS